MYTRFTYTDRIKLEALYNSKMPIKDISRHLHKHISSIYRELTHGFYQHLNTDYTYTKKYSADKAQRYARFNSTTKGRQMKIGNDHKFVTFVEKMIKKKYSPAAILAYIKEHNLTFQTDVCITTLYSYIDKGVFLHVTNNNLLYKGSRRKCYRKVQTVKKPPRGESIEHRPKEVAQRTTFGHWEMDSVIGKREKGNTLVVLTERLTRKEIIFKAKDKTALTTVQLLNRLERFLGKDFRKVFKTITVDNGSEFSAFDLMERSCLTKKPRTKIYYCHPYSSWERGSNENQNRMIRRFIPKGTSIKPYSNEDIKAIEEYINNYPRKIFNYKSSQQLFESELSKINVKKIL